MTTTLKDCRILLSKEMGDYWASESTTPSLAATTTLTDTQLAAKANDWIDGDREMYDLITDADVNEHEERKLSSLASGVLTMIAHTSNNDAGVSYEVHRLFTASEKRRALIHAAKAVYPHLFIEIRDETKTSGTWGINGCFTNWASSNYPDYHRVSTITAAENTDLLYVKRGTASCKLTRSGTDGYLYIDEDRVYDFKSLYNQNVTFSCYVFPDTDDQVRLAIYDGTDTTYSNYNSVTDAFEKLTVTATIDDDPSAIEFRIYVEEDGDVFVSDERIIGPSRNKIYIGDLGLVQNKPHQVLIEPTSYTQDEPWVLIHNIRYDQTNGYMYLPNNVSSDYRLRILGNKYLYFHDTAGDEGTDWDDDSIALDDPQIEILVAQAIIYLCIQKVVPNDTSGESKRWAQSLAYWQGELRGRINRFGMISQSLTVSWR